MTPFRKINNFDNFFLEQAKPIAPNFKGFEGSKIKSSATPYPRLIKLPNGKYETRYFSEPGQKDKEPEVNYDTDMSDDEMDKIGAKLKKNIEDKNMEFGLVGRDATATKFSPPGPGWRFPIPKDPNQDVHNLFLYACLGVIALPILGVSAEVVYTIGVILGLSESLIYYLEGDFKMGSAMLFFSLVGHPDVAKFLSQTFLKASAKFLPTMFRITEAQIISLGQKLAAGNKKLTEFEFRFLRNIIKYKTQIFEAIDNYLKKKAADVLKSKTILSKVTATVKKEVVEILQGFTKGIYELAKFLYTPIKKTGKFFIKLAAGFAPWVIGFEAFKSTWDWVQIAKGDVDAKVKEEGTDWETAKSTFGSKGEKEDNIKLKKAWEKGWRPGKEVPKELQTKEYQEKTGERQEEKESIDNVEALIKKKKSEK